MKTYLKNIPPGLAWQRLALKRKKPDFFRPNFYITEERKKERFLLNDKIVLSICN